VGSAVPFAAGFVTGALVPSGKTTTAAVCVTSPALPAARTIDLGAVHGDVLAPRVATKGADLFVAVPDGAPNGTLLRLARVDDVAGKGAVTWGAEVTTGRDESDAFALELGDKVGLLAWDEWNARAEHGEIRLVTFAGRDVTKVSAPSVVSPGHDDAESPSIVARPGGFWAAWIVNVHREPDEKTRSAAAPDQAPVDLGPRYVVVAPLDEAGKSLGAPSALSSKDGHATGFDLATLGDGALLVAYRDEAASAAGAGGTVHLVRVMPDGSSEPRPFGDDEATVGLPSLLADSAPPKQTVAWLSLTSDADATRLVALDATGRPLDVLGAEAPLGSATPLAVHAGHMLVTRSRGTAAVLSTYACDRGSTDVAPPGSAAPSAEPPPEPLPE
jgi:hypothetical protein